MPAKSIADAGRLATGLTIDRKPQPFLEGPPPLPHRMGRGAAERDHRRRSQAGVYPHAITTGFHGGPEGENTLTLEEELWAHEKHLGELCMEFQGLAIAGSFSGHMASAIRRLEMRLAAMKSSGSARGLGAHIKAYWHLTRPAFQSGQPISSRLVLEYLALYQRSVERPDEIDTGASVDTEIQAVNRYWTD
jgi:hypothetical protein